MHLFISFFVTDFVRKNAKNQENICKCLGIKSGKLILRPDRRMDRLTDKLTDGQRTAGLTDCKPKVPFGFAGRGLNRGVVRLENQNKYWKIKSNVLDLLGKIIACQHMLFGNIKENRHN